MKYVASILSIAAFGIILISVLRVHILVEKLTEANEQYVTIVVNDEEIYIPVGNTFYFTSCVEKVPEPMPKQHRHIIKVRTVDTTTREYRVRLGLEADSYHETCNRCREAEEVER